MYDGSKQFVFRKWDIYIYIKLPVDHVLLIFCSSVFKSSFIWFEITSLICSILSIQAYFYFNCFHFLYEMFQNKIFQIMLNINKNFWINAGLSETASLAMAYFLTFLLTSLFVGNGLSRLNDLNTVESYMNICMLGKQHKSSPGPEKGLTSKVSINFTFTIFEILKLL